MPSVVIGRPGERIAILSDVCVKSGARTSDRTVLRGSTTPAWVTLLLLFSIIGWLIAATMTSRRYEVVVPFRRDLYARWRRTYLVSWLIGLGGVALAVTAGMSGFHHPGLLLGVSAVGGVLGLGNSWVNTAGVVLRDDELVLTRVHPAFTASLARVTA